MGDVVARTGVSGSEAMDRFETLRFEQTGHVGHLVLDRPGKLNAFTPQMWAELRTLGRALLDDPRDLRVVIVRGEGRAFSSGIDTSVFGGRAFDDVGGQVPSDDGGPRHDDPAVRAILTAQDSYSWLEAAPFVTIAAVHGYALGAGLQLALACDLRVVARGAQLGLLEHKYGILPDLGGTQRLPRLVGRGKALELIVTAARIHADEALTIGLVERVVGEEELLEAVETLAAQIAAQPPLAVQGAKRAVHAALDGRSVREGLVVEAEAQAVCLGSADFREAITAFLEGRVADYRGA